MHLSLDVTWNRVYCRAKVLSMLVHRVFVIFTRVGRLILVGALSTWDMCWLVKPTILANCSCANPGLSEQHGFEIMGKPEGVC